MVTGCFVGHDTGPSTLQRCVMMMVSSKRWDIIGQGTVSLTTISAVVKHAEGDKYVTNSLVLSFMHTCMKSLAEDQLH